MSPLELWGGVECTVNRVGQRYFDQIERSGHLTRLGDLDRFAALGITSLRCPILWERLAPRSLAEVNWASADAYLARVRERRMTPIVGLVHHGSGPRSTSLVHERFPELLAQYARAVAERYPWVDAWTPINEPLTTARFSGLYGHWYPHGRNDRVFVRALLTQMRGVTASMHAIRRVNPRARLVQTEDIGTSFGPPRLHEQLQHERIRRWLTWDLLIGAVDRHHPLYAFLRDNGATERELAAFAEQPCPPDVLGVNYYVTSDRWLDDRVDAYPSWAYGGNGRIAYADVEAVRARARGVAGHRQHLLDAWHRYQRPMAITEVHLGCTRDEQIRWFHEAWQAARDVRAGGADVRAVTAWALLGSFDWDSLVTEDRGHYEPGLFDLRGPVPRATALATVASELAAGRPPDLAPLREKGWWRRPERLLYRPHRRAPDPRRSPTSSPILIVGMHGTLGRALQAICRDRGLAVHPTDRAALDAANPRDVERVIRRYSPWAIVNAAGYVRVDDAEQDGVRCWRDNVQAPVNLALACARHGIRFVTFSSDLVFDGSKRHPYTEVDLPRPLNTYGTTKQAAERHVRAVLPDALIIRTSAFFGPWDSANFATRLLGALSNDAPVRAAADCVVSPTYVPDLVHAMLDLLIDGEYGIWHLANEGSITWYTFGRMLARLASLPDELIEPCSSRDLGPARRPAYSALGSGRGGLLRPLDAAVAAYLKTTAAARRQPCLADRTRRCG